MKSPVLSRDAKTAINFCRLLSIGCLIMIGATWDLWTPHDLFPRIPLISGAAGLPDAVDWIALLAMIGALVVVLLVPVRVRVNRYALLLFAIAFLLSVLRDQQRIQTWSYEFAVMAVVLALAHERRAVTLLRCFVISIYAYSAISKLDHSFIVDQGNYLLEAILGTLGVSWSLWSEKTRILATAVLPVGELLVAIALSIPKLRRIGFWGAVLMHTLLMLAVGPLGLDHYPGVFLWNTFFIVQDVLLFGKRSTAAEASSGEETAAPMPAPAPPRDRGTTFATVLTAIAIILPATEPFGGYDHWPSWGLYAMHHEKVNVYVRADRRREVAERIGEDVVDGPDMFTYDKWCRVKIERWSLDSLEAPIYPQERFQVGVALWLDQECDLDEGIRIVIEGRAERFSGARTSEELVGREAIVERANTYRLTAFPVK